MQRLVFVANAFRLSPDQLRSVADISRDAGQVLFGTVVIPPLISGEANLVLLAIGLTATLAFWYGNLAIVRKLEV